MLSISAESPVALPAEPELFASSVIASLTSNTSDELESIVISNLRVLRSQATTRPVTLPELAVKKLSAAQSPTRVEPVLRVRTTL